MLGIGLIGCGEAARAQLPAWLALRDRARIVAVYDRDGAEAGRLAAELGGVRVAAGIGALPADTGVNAVVIQLPVAGRAAAIEAAAMASRPIFCEAPICETEEEARRIETVLQAGGTLLLPGHLHLFQPVIAIARALLEDGALGTIYMARATGCVREQTPSGGALHAAGYHPATVMNYLLGLAGQTPRQVSAALARNRRPSGTGADGAQALVSFSGGAIGHLLISRAFSMPPGFHTFHLVGERGQLFGHDRLLFHLPVGAEAPERHETPTADWRQAMLAHFLDCAAGGAAPLQGAGDAALGLAVIEAVARSGAEGRAVEVASA